MFNINYEPTTSFAIVCVFQNEPRFRLNNNVFTCVAQFSNSIGESRVSWATFYNILSGVFPVDRRIVLNHSYILHIYPTSTKDEKNNLKKCYGYTTESGESGSTDLLYGVSCAKQVGRLITYGKKSQLTNVHANMLFLSRKCINKKINTSVHHIRVKFVDKSLPSPKWYNLHYSLYWCMDHCFLVFIKKIYTIIVCLYYIDLLYNVICYTTGISHYIIIYFIPTGVWWAMSSGVCWSTFCNNIFYLLG